ncbi:MAG: tRNA pseudouridine(55) synthase TruB [Gammaproteobacteria bacterium]|nr:MAG: tRNA pseudouridine(55) synthase TruB [Gammaproteobacteria bacterium]
MARRRKRGRPVHGILLLDKPAGMSSNQALQKARRLLDAQKAGHTGTLDPLATGMLPLCFGEATRLSSHLLAAEKAYETTLVLGVQTHSADADGELIAEQSIPAELDRDRFEAICAGFRGEQLQVPPMVSALKRNGKRLYELARQGVEVEREPRRVTIDELEVLAFSVLDDTRSPGSVSARLRVRCSKGTYIRSLVSDIGDVIGCGAHVAALRRLYVEPFSTAAEGDSRQGEGGSRRGEMVTLAALEAIDKLADREALLLPPEAGLDYLAAVEIDAASAVCFGNGQVVAATGVAEPAAGEAAAAANASLGMVDGAIVRVYQVASGAAEGHSRRFLGLGAVAKTGRSGLRIAPRKVMQWD